MKRYFKELGLKIFHVNQTFADTGGVNTYMLSLIQLLDQEGIVNIPVYLEEHEKQLTYNGVAYWTPTLSSLILILKAESPDVVLIHSVYHPEIISYLAQHYPTIAYMHGFYPVCPGLAKYYRRNGRQCERAFGWGCAMKIYTHRCASARRPDNVFKIIKRTFDYRKSYQNVKKIVVPSGYMKQLFIQNQFDEKLIEVLPPHFVNSERNFTLIAERPEKTVLYVGRLEIEKGVPYLLKAIALLDASICLHIAGDGTKRQDYESMANLLGIGSRVTYLGWLSHEQLEHEYQRANVLVMPSLIESFGISGVEAMINGLPVIAFNVGGIKDWLVDGETGYLIPPLDVEILADRINQLLQDKNLANSMGIKGKELVIKSYRADQYLKKILEILQAAQK